MSSSFIHDPLGIIVFESPTSVTVKFGMAESEVTVSVLPYSNLREYEEDDGELTVWAGEDTYTIPKNAEYTLVDVSFDNIDVGPNEINKEEVSIKDLIEANSNTSEEQ